jgi:hypothetical protein
VSLPPQPSDDARLKRILAWIRWIVTKKEVIRRQGPRLQIAVGIVLLAGFYFTGLRQITLIQKGVLTQGKIVGHELAHFRSRRGSTTHSSSAYMPIVEFPVGGRIVRFRDMKGSNSGGGVGEIVPVIFDPSDPSVALIERKVWKWIPWAPMMGLGLFLLWVGILGELRFRRSP